MNTARSGVSEKTNASNSGCYAETKILASKNAAQGSFKRQIIVTFVVGFLLLATAFGGYQVSTESAFLYRGSTDETASLAESLAASSRSWVLADDVVGLQEVVNSFRVRPELRYAMVISPSGRVLAHSDAKKVGQFLSDEASMRLLKSSPMNRIMIDDESISDIAAPVMVDNRQVGWARVGQGRERILGNLRKMMLSSALFVLVAMVLSLFAALLIAKRLGYRIEYLMQLAEEVKAGNYAMRATISGADEISKLANSLNHMLDVLAREDEQLRSASLYTRSLIEASLDPLVTISPEGKITDVNKAGEIVTGRSRAELIGTDFSNYFTEPEKAREGYQQVFQKGTATDYPLALCHRDGHVTDVLYNASVYRNEKGEVLGVFAAARDITERKRVELEREQYFKFFNSSTDLMCIADPNGCFKKINPACSRTLGYAESELLAKPFVEFVYPDDRQETLDEMARQIQRGYSLKFENRYLCKDGSFRWLSWGANFIKDEGITYATARDITELKQAEDKINELNRNLERRVVERTAQLEAANKELEAFSYSVSHDLRTPLRAIDGFSHVLLDDYVDKLDDEGKRLLNVVRDNSQRMGKLIDDILNFSRTSRLEMTFSEIDMEGLAHSVIEELQPLIAGRQMQVEIEKIPQAMGDPAMMHQIFVNLLSNAIKFSHFKEHAMIKMGSYVEADETVYFVRDNGAGFNMQYADKLFGAFQRLHGMDEFEGTGIGLAIVKRIVTRHGGRVWAEGKVNEGATIYFALPTKDKANLS